MHSSPTLIFPHRVYHDRAAQATLASARSDGIKNLPTRTMMYAPVSKILDKVKTEGSILGMAGGRS